MEHRNYYNIIFTGGNIPAMMAAIICLDNGYPSYVYIERGKTYTGIDLVPDFINIGFNVDDFQSVDDEKSFMAVVNTIKAVKEKDSNAYFYMYISESRGLKCAAMAANAGLTKDDFHVFMLEDGIDSYKRFDMFYGYQANIENIFTLLYKITKRKWASRKAAEKIVARLKAVSQKKGPAASLAKAYLHKASGKVFDRTTKEVTALYETIMSKTDNRYDLPSMIANYQWAFPLSSLDNFSYSLQDKKKIQNIVKSTQDKKFAEIFDLENDGANSRLKVEYKNLSDRFGCLSAEKQKLFLGLMFGHLGEVVAGQFTRTTRADVNAPARKLVYINSRHYTMFIKPVTNKVYGLGPMSGAQFPDSYEKLDDKYKSPLLFANETDYDILLKALGSIDRNTLADPQLKLKAKQKTFDLYADYVFTARLLFALYGNSYDIFVKNHPRTDMGCSDSWPNFYLMGYGETENVVDFGVCLDNALMEFHKSDSIGRYIGVVNGGLSSECFEYINPDISFAGQPSSVYSGLSDNAQIPFIITDGNADISGSQSDHVAYSAVAGRYLEDRMKYTDSEGNTHTTVFYNTGNTLKACAKVCADMGEEKLAAFYTSLFEKWLKKAHPEATDIDNQGFAVK